MQGFLSCARMARAIVGPAALAVLVSACGGGGRGDPQNDRIAGLTPERATVTCSADPGIACADSLMARPADGYSQGDLVRTVTPASGTASPIDRLDHDTLPDGRWRISVHFKRDMPAGTYTGTIDINVFALFDDFRASTLRYIFTQAPDTGDLRPLAPLSGASGWQGVGGNATHTGAVPVTLDASAFSRRWTAGGVGVGPLSMPATAAGRVHVVGTPSGGSVGTLWAYDEHSGAAAWSQALGAPGHAPATDGSRVFVRSAPASGLLLTAFDAADGTPLYSQNAPWPSTFAAGQHHPVTAWGGSLYGSDARGGAVTTRDAATGADGWSVSLRGSTDPSFENWTPALTDTQVFTNVLGRFRALRRSDGVEIFSLAVAGPTSGSLQTLHALNQAPVVVDADSVLLLDHRRSDGSATANQLTMIDLPSRQVRWTATGAFTTQPVAAHGIVVAGNQQNKSVEVRSAATGDLLWSWASAHADDETIGSLLLTDNLLFVAAGQRTVALDLQTHQPVWSYPLAGHLALSANGLLYIVSADPAIGGRVVAINLR